MKPKIKSLLFITTFIASTSVLPAEGQTKQTLPLNGTIPETVDSAKIELENEKTAPIYSTDDVIIEHLYVETEVDTDGDGELDRVSIQVMRPNTDSDVEVPVIYEMSPYRSGINPINFHDVDVDLTPVEALAGVPFANEATTQNLGRLGNYYVPRGYGVILGESIGTGLSTGCPTTGDMNEILGTKAVIDWLNGEARAFNEEGEEVGADWSTGNVGMTGASYNGTLPNGVATTGVEGLKTIIPVVAISSWYDYFRANGAVVAPGGFQGEDTDNLAEGVLTRDNREVCEGMISSLFEGQDRASGDYNEFWAERDYVKDADQIEASVFVVHGLADWNVKTTQFAQWWEALKEHDITRKMWLHQGGHSGAPVSMWQETEHRWFDYWLYGIENGIVDEPMVDVQREDGSWNQEADWPAVEMEEKTLHFNSLNEGYGGTLRVDANADAVNEMFTDNPAIRANQLVEDPQLSNPHRLSYLSPALSEDVRLSGTPKISLEASIDQPVANLTALLVNYSGSNAEIISRGWMDPQNRNSVQHSEAIVPGETYTFEWEIEPKDHVFEAGHQIGVIIMASDHEYTLRPPAGTGLTVVPGASNITLPLVGDENSWTISSGSIQSHIQQFADEGAFENEETVRALQLHLIAISRYESQQSSEKIVRHMGGFQHLLTHQLENDLISEQAYDTLRIQGQELVEYWN
ncbi:putative Xaa-Pro dipeptidyl-peptidase [Geomicrobium sp. JCM 19039]|nr:putative Xaa-Pro dipeptidyl-peptidase [Geomicrobium sp. JCM 19039]